MRGDEARRRLLADPGHAGEPVRRIAAQEREVAVGPTRDAVAARDLGLVDLEQLGDADQRVEDAHVGIAHQREQVAVARDDLDRLAGPRREGRDHVLGLEALGADDGDAEGPEHLATERFLRRDRVGLVGDAVGLVRGQGLDPERRAPVLVDGDAEPVRPPVRDQAGEHVQEPVHGVHGHALRDGVEAAEEEARVVDQHQHRRAAPPSARHVRIASVPPADL